MSAIKEQVRDAIYAHREQLAGLAHDLHEHPEVAFCEEYAAEHLAGYLAAQGFDVHKGICGMPTAFVATTGHGPLHVAFCAEYDALPPACLYDRSKPPELTEIWLSPERRDTPLRHACGHNLIAGAALAAAVGLRDIVDAAGLTVSVFGTPGEELYGIPEPADDCLVPGKVALLQGGAFEGVHAALMIHPFPTPFGTWVPTHTYARVRARFAPPRGEKETPRFDAAELKRLREALKQTITKRGQIPTMFIARPEQDHAGAQAEMGWCARSMSEAAPAREAVRRCFEETAAAAGVTVEIAEFAPGALMCDDPMLAASYRKNAEVLGRMRGQDEKIQAEIRELFSSSKVPLPLRLIARLVPRLVSPPGLFMSQFPVNIVFGTDLGNVSQVIPAIHPFIGIGGMHGCHEAEFADQTESDEARRAMLDGGVALAWTAVDAAAEPAIRDHLMGK